MAHHATQEELSDAEICAMVAAGRRESALRALMQRHGDAVARYCRAALGDDAAADDVLQQVFIEVHRDLHNYSARSGIKAWIFGIARHRVLDQKRSQRRAAPRSQPLEDLRAPDPRPLARELLDKVRVHRALEDCLSELSAQVRTALVLRYQQGFSFEEMSEICDEKAGTLQARVARSLPVLRDCLERRTGGSP
ncbi:MAG: RNA polymerase sigma factor [Kofleriaceae bacterium]